MGRKNKQNPKESNVFFVSRDKLCPNALIDSKENPCLLPPSHDYALNYCVVYNINHLECHKYDCGCIVYNNKYYYEFKFPELIWIDFFKHQISAGEKLVKFTINRSEKKS